MHVAFKETLQIGSHMGTVVLPIDPPAIMVGKVPLLNVNRTFEEPYLTPVNEGLTFLAPNMDYMLMILVSKEDGANYECLVHVSNIATLKNISIEEVRALSHEGLVDMEALGFNVTLSQDRHLSFEKVGFLIIYNIITVHMSTSTIIFLVLHNLTIIMHLFKTSSYLYIMLSNSVEAGGAPTRHRGGDSARLRAPRLSCSHQERGGDSISFIVRLSIYHPIHAYICQLFPTCIDL